MSLDACYIFVYEHDQNFLAGKDIAYLSENYGGEFNYLGCHSYFWNKPKYTLLDTEHEKLHAIQILELKEGWEYWRTIYSDKVISLTSVEDNLTTNLINQRRKYEELIKCNMDLREQVEIWKDLYRNNKRHHTNILDAQNSIELKEI